MAAPSKKHHYVPRAQLAHFSIDGGGKQVWVFDKQPRAAYGGRSTPSIRTKHRPGSHHSPPLLQEVGPLIGKLRGIADGMGKTGLDNLTRRVGLFGSPVSER